MTTRLQFTIAILALYGFAATPLCGSANADEIKAWNSDSLVKELRGMRNYSLAITNLLTKSLKKTDKASYPGLHAFLKQAATATEKIKAANASPTAKGKASPIKTQSLFSHNPKFWAAYYECEPGDPIIMWLQACLCSANGDHHRALYTQTMTLRAEQLPGPLAREVPRLVVSNQRAIRLCEKRILVGTKLHDAREFTKAESVFREVLNVCPNHSLALYELGNTLGDLKKKKEDSPTPQSCFEKARLADPFMSSAYQGTMTAEQFKQKINISNKGLPAWSAFIAQPHTQVDAKTMKQLSLTLQECQLDELALKARQIAIFHSTNDYDDDDRAFIKTSLKRLLAKNTDLSPILKRLNPDAKRYSFVNSHGADL